MPTRKIAPLPNPKTNPNPTLNPNWGTIFLGETAWLSPNTKTNPNIDPNPNLNWGVIFLEGWRGEEGGDNCPDTSLDKITQLAKIHLKVVLKMSYEDTQDISAGCL